MPGRFLIGLIVVGGGVGAGNAAERQSLRPQALFQHGAVLEPEAHGRDRSLVQSGSGNPSFQLQPVFLTFLRLNQEGERPDRVAVPGQTAGDAAYKMGGRAGIYGVGLGREPHRADQGNAGEPLGVRDPDCRRPAGGVDGELHGFLRKLGTGLWLQPSKIGRASCRERV